MSLIRKYKLYTVGIIPDSESLKNINEAEQHFINLDIDKNVKYSHFLYMIDIYFSKNESVFIYDSFTNGIWLNSKYHNFNQDIILYLVLKYYNIKPSNVGTIGHFTINDLKSYFKDKNSSQQEFH